MKQASRKSAQVPPVTAQIGRGLREGGLIVLGAVALFLLLALATYHPSDPGWSHSSAVRGVANKGGVVGAWFADLLLYLFGYLAYLFPLMIAYSGLLVYRGRRRPGGGADYLHLGARAAGFVLTLAGGSGIAWMYFSAGSTLPVTAGGVLGDLAGGALVSVFGELGGTLFLLALFFVGITLFTGMSWLWLMDTTGDRTLDGLAFLRRKWGDWREALAARRARRRREESVVVERERSRKRKAPRIEPTVTRIEESARVEKERQVPLFEPAPETDLPSLALLDEAKHSEGGYSRDALEAMSRQVELKLRDFGIEVEVVAVLPGPVVTRFEIQPAPGVKVSQINNLAKDLARSLSVISVRVVDVIPGKSVIGIEIPNEQREMVYLSEILRSREYEASGSPLTLALGKDISGKPEVADLAKMPHLLVAGTTGSGKSVALNAMIVSLLYKATMNDVRLIMIDPKMLELSVYEGVPHLLSPVVTDVKDAANALRWCVAEMERRYALMAALAVRNINGYNRKVRDAMDAGKPIPDPKYQPVGEDDEHPTLTPLPYIVVIVDELADMMMIVGKKVEQLIARLAQKARAAGIHLILATQRPSVDVITGLIKANIPTRIAFQVSSKVDSRTILDQMGAEALLGHGDMLFLSPGSGPPARLHGAFVGDHEVHQVVDDWKKRGTPEYVDEIVSGPSEGAQEPIPGVDVEAGNEADPLYDQAVRIVTESRRASISGVQRRLKIGYNRAARMIEEMERAGVVSEVQSNGSREVLAPPPPPRP